MQEFNIVQQAANHDELAAIYLQSMRNRFKAEVNRLTSGAMAGMLRDHHDVEQLSFLMSYVYAFHWFQHNVHQDYREAVLSAFSKGRQAFLMQMILHASDTPDFVSRYIDYWLKYDGEPELQQHNIRQLLQRYSDVQALVDEISSAWDGLDLFNETYAEAYRDLAREERDRYRSMLDDADRERLQFVDSLPDSVSPLKPFAKLGVIPAMGCPQTCRHCMFIWRPLVKPAGEVAKLYEMVNGITENVLFTGGDLSRHLQHFYDAIATMRHVSTFAILLNGDFADTPDITGQVLASMSAAVNARPDSWPKASILLQISFDEFHQEVTVDKKGQLHERIPVNKIANIVEAAPRHEAIQLCLLHKQHALNFSMDIFKKGVFGRLAAELARRGHQVQVVSASPSKRLKENPLQPGSEAQIVKDATFVLSSAPERPIMMTSSTIDGYGRASKMDEGETVKEKALLAKVLNGQVPPGEAFDTDLMFWFNGWTTLFSAVHICLGDVFADGLDRIRRRHQKDPLCRALNRFDLRLLELYAEKRDDLQQKIDEATGPHHLFHCLTEDSEIRLHMTRRLAENG